VPRLYPVTAKQVAAMVLLDKIARRLPDCGREHQVSQAPKGLDLME